VTGAEDLDEWQEAGATYQSGDTLSYAWRSVDAADNEVGSFTGTGANRTWQAPGTPGTYRLRCEVDDGGVVPTGDAGNRDDAPVMATELTVTVLTPHKVIIYGSTPENEGPFDLRLGSAVTLLAKSDSAFPPGCPEWRILSKPTTSNLGDPADGGTTLTITPDKVSVNRVL
jgi:hypothetical protein